MNRCFSKEGINGQQECEKVHRWNENQNHDELTSQLLEYYQKGEMTSAGKNMVKREHLFIIVGTWTGTATMENNIKVPLIIKNRTIIWFSNHNSGYLFEENKKTLTQKDIRTPLVHCSISYSCQDGKATSVSINAWIDKDVLYINTKEYYSTIYKKGSLALC